MNDNRKKNHAIAILCSGLDDVMRGYETHTRLLFDNLTEEFSDKKIFLYKRNGKRKKNEFVLRCPSRRSFIVGILKKIRGDGLYWEYLFFSLKFIFHCILKNNKFDKILIIEPMAAKTVTKFKCLLPGSPIIIFTHGVWIEPEDYLNMGDVFHQPNIENHIKQKKYFTANSIEKPSFLIPHFIPDSPTNQSLVVDNNEIRKKYNVKTRYVLLSVGVINRAHKNMEYLINETLKLPEDWTLILCGRIDEPDLIDKGREELGDRFIHLYVDRGEIEEIYQLADIFVLASKQEGFGIVILEAMRAGLPVILHDRELFHWILKSSESCVRMDIKGKLSTYIINKQKNNFGWIKCEGEKNRVIFESEYNWTSLKKKYTEMLFFPE